MSSYQELGDRYYIFFKSHEFSQTNLNRCLIIPDPLTKFSVVTNPILTSLLFSLLLIYLGLVKH